jgi:vitamin K-dependent gamma-carboxylase
MTDPAAPLARLRRRLGQPVDVAWLAAFRALFGALMVVSGLRCFWNGWIARFFIAPQVHLKYDGFAWVAAWPGWGMYLHYAALVALALLVALGLWYRIAIVLFVLAFGYAQLVDASLYLNHYYLISLLGLLLCFLPAHAAFSLDARRSPALRRATVPAWCLYLVRFQVAVVYSFAGLAKLGPDWLLHGQPLGIWLSSRTDVPLVGRWLDAPGVALAASWAGFLFDTTIVWWLSWRRTRLPAYLAVVAFHLATQLLFPIGMFPAIMVVAALVFFDPSWPRRLLRRAPAAVPAAGSAAAPQAPPGRVALAAGVAYALVQLLVPLRAQLHPGNVLWHEQGMRWSWRVMVREKNGSVTFVVRDRASGRVWYVPPRQYLRDHQEREMSTQPALIRQVAELVARDYRRRLGRPVEVRAEALASLNGRRAAPLVAATVNLADDTAAPPAGWILPAPPGPPAPAPGYATAR